MADIPDEAVKAALEAREGHGSEPMPGNPNRCRCGRNFRTAVEQLEHVVRLELQAALRHIPGVE